MELAGTSSETIIMSHYLGRLEEIAEDCLEPQKGYTAGVTWVGEQENFFAYLGGVPTTGLNGGNGTARK